MSIESLKIFVDRANPLIVRFVMRLASLGQCLSALLRIWRGRIEARHYLARMDARSLREAGISPAAAAYECGKPFWKKMGLLR